MVESALVPLSDQERAAAFAALDLKYQTWVQKVRGLMTPIELDFFLRLTEDFRRDAFMEAFWEPRDPDPSTSRNELKERWQSYADRGGLPYDDDRFLLLLFNGPPTGYTLRDGRPVTRCFSRSRELEIWFYKGSERIDGELPVILLQRGAETRYEVYRQGQNLRAVQRSGGLPTTDIQQLCADELLRYALYEMDRSPGYARALELAMSPPLPSPEWLANYSASATDLPRGAETFEASFELGYPARKQSRTAVRAMFGVGLDQAPGRRFEGELYHNFQLAGEVIRDGKLFESFRYRFEGPTPDGVATIPLGFTRYLRPGPASLRILLEDLYTGRFHQVVREIEVPRPDGLPPVPAALDAGRSALDRPSLELVTPAGDVHVGKIRFRARSTGTIEKVTFYVDDRPVLSKRQPPYSVELDLGPDPAPRRVRVVGFVDEREVATDQLWLNQGALRFRAHLIEPRPGGIYPGAVTARVQVDTPDGRAPERVELFVNDQPAATLRPASATDLAPLSHSLRLPGSEVAVVRAVAYLADGSAAEDAVVVNASPFTETVDVRLVELGVLVTDGAGNPVAGLDRDRVRVFEDDVEQAIRRFEPARDAPLQAALMIDRSASMEPYLERVAAAAGAFAAAAASSPQDRVAVLSFADSLTVDAGFQAGAGALERALAGLDALGGTALYDSLVQAFNNFEGVRGAQALLLFSDGQDEGSRLSFEQTLETARRSTVPLYAIGLAEAFPDKPARRVLEDLAAETGGRAWFIDRLEELPAVYDAILGELRARYLVAYQSTSAKGDSEYRKVQVEVDLRGAKVRARRGYYP